jgi:hypothetical protein
MLSEPNAILRQILGGETKFEMEKCVLMPDEILVQTAVDF